MLWRCRFLTDVGQIKLMQAVQGGWSAQGTGIHRAIPPVAADAERVYANWLGVVFALDRATGKLLWTTRPFHEMANGFAEMAAAGQRAEPGAVPRRRRVGHGGYAFRGGCSCHVDAE